MTTAESKAVISGAPIPAIKAPEIFKIHCRNFFQNGVCRFGDECMDSHETSVKMKCDSCANCGSYSYLFQTLDGEIQIPDFINAKLSRASRLYEFHSANAVFAAMYHGEYPCEDYPCDDLCFDSFRFAVDHGLHIASTMIEKAIIEKIKEKSPFHVMFGYQHALSADMYLAAETVINMTKGSW
jgi:hypothetical protein